MRLIRVRFKTRSLRTGILDGRQNPGGRLLRPWHGIQILKGACLDLELDSVWIF